MLVYLDDFLIAPTRHVVESRIGHCTRAKKTIEKLMRQMGLTRQPTKGEWTESTLVEHLGVTIDTMKMSFYIAPRKVEKVQDLAKLLLSSVWSGRRLVKVRTRHHFCGVCVSLTLAMPWTRFYTRDLYWDKSARKSRDFWGRCRLSHQSVRDLGTWQRLSEEELSRRPMVPEPLEASLHTDALDMGYGGTLSFQSTKPEVDGQWSEQGVWNWKERAASIT